MLLPKQLTFQCCRGGLCQFVHFCAVSQFLSPATAAAAAAAAAAVVTDVSFFDILMLFGHTVNVVAETVGISVLQERCVSVCAILRSFAVSCTHPYKQTTHYSILGVLDRVRVVE